MIVLKISNSSEVVAAKVGKFLEFLTPDSIDDSAVEDQVIKKLVENLAAEGIKGEIAAVKGLDHRLIVKHPLKQLYEVKNQVKFCFGA